MRVDSWEMEVSKHVLQESKNGRETLSLINLYINLRSTGSGALVFSEITFGHVVPLSQNLTHAAQRPLYMLLS